MLTVCKTSLHVQLEPSGQKPCSSLPVATVDSLIGMTHNPTQKSDVERRSKSFIELDLCRCNRCVIKGALKKANWS